MNLQHPDFKHILKAKKLILLVALLCVIPSLVFAADSTAKAPAGESKFEAGDMILEHVGDAHSWHIAGDVSISLPIIVYSSTHGLSIFSSGKLKDGAIYNGYKLIRKDGEHVIAVNADGSENKEETAKLWDLSLTKTATSVVI